MKSLRLLALVFLVLFNVAAYVGVPVGFMAVTSCTAVAPPYSQETAQAASDYEAQTLGLIDLSAGEFAGHAEAVTALTAAIQNQAALELTRPHNKSGTNQWVAVSEMVSAYFDSWRDGGPRSPALIKHAKSLVSEGFASIRRAEADRPGHP